MTGNDEFLEYIAKVSENEAILWMPISKYFTLNEGKRNLERSLKVDGYFFCYIKDKNALYFIGKGSKNISKDAYRDTIQPLTSIYSEEKIKLLQQEFIEKHTKQVEFYGPQVTNMK
ncbi:hypothetical protein [Paenibacillus sedimenti]|uniref:Uncharacterized protein n=1 Tax=Paenibacillus sedimenti TaxID=2770274 RepID=A0A926QME6_9BACL|nr:hypothetical protein [Paenibacillus sedimenti]MBD0383304.1 hypothetical protein [Paenibacillus sedimenti]